MTVMSVWSEGGYQMSKAIFLQPYGWTNVTLAQDGAELVEAIERLR